jgi:hypothetical protein
MDAGCSGLFVSKPTPTFDLGQPRTLHPPPMPSGSEPAREGFRSVDMDAGCSGLFVSKPTPTLDLGRPESFIHHQSTVGAGLLRAAFRRRRHVSRHGCCMFRPLREQAHSHFRSRPAPNPSSTTNAQWERACSRRRQVSRHGCWMFRPLREQAHSHFRSRPAPNPPSTTNLLWERACSGRRSDEGARSVDMDAGCSGLFVSKPTPTFDLGQPRTLHPPPIYCWSEPAREGVMSGDMDAECANPFVSKPTPTLDLGQPRILHPPPIYCGSGLAPGGVPTKASGQSTWMLDVPASS